MLISITAYLHVFRWFCFFEKLLFIYLIIYFIFLPMRTFLNIFKTIVIVNTRDISTSCFIRNFYGDCTSKQQIFNLKITSIHCMLWTKITNMSYSPQKYYRMCTASIQFSCFADHKLMLHYLANFVVFSCKLHIFTVFFMFYTLVEMKIFMLEHYSCNITIKCQKFYSTKNSTIFQFYINIHRNNELQLYMYNNGDNQPKCNALSLYKKVSIL
jgi:hypothetical protein